MLEQPHKSGYIAIVGRPNVGKSSLMNALLGTKLAIVSPKPQTTRESILGILSTKNEQLIFLDTPGWLKPVDQVQSYMKKAIFKSLYDDADVVLWLLEAKELTEDEKLIAQTLGKIPQPVFIVINKIDLHFNEEIVKRISEEINVMLGGKLAKFLRVSALILKGIPELRNQLLQSLPEGPAFYPKDQVTDRWERFYVSELIREKIFDIYKDEIPHASAVLVEDFVENKGRKDVIKAVILVETLSQQKILVGNKGSAIKNLGQKARKEIEDRLGRPVYLELVVKVRPKWRQDSGFLKTLLER
ncbi:MAG: GTPase Era [Elusimicrobiota bacterium]